MAIVVAYLPALSASSLPGMAEWPGIYWMEMEEELELMELWIKQVQGFDDIRASYNDDGWLALVNNQDNADSMAATSIS